LDQFRHQYGSQKISKVHIWHTFVKLRRNLAALGVWPIDTYSRSLVNCGPRVPQYYVATCISPSLMQKFVIMVALCNRADHYIFALWFLSSIYLLFSLPNLSGCRLDVYHTSTHGVALVRIYNAGLKCADRGSLQIQDAKKSPKIPIWAPSHNFDGLYLRN